MKILIATSDVDHNALMVLAFKNLNLANSIEFVDCDDQIFEYLESGINLLHELPDLLLYGLPTDGRDALQELYNNSKWENLKVVTFTTQRRKNIFPFDENPSVIFHASNIDELVWILQEICDNLVSKEGWQYNAFSLESDVGTGVNPAISGTV